MRSRLIVIFLLCLANSFLAQGKITLKDITSKYEAIEYKEVIYLSETMLNYGDVPVSERVEIYTMKAISHFALSQENEAKICFFEILKLNRDFDPDPIKVSPKIISFFNEIKDEFLRNNPLEKPNEKQTIDSPSVVDKNSFLQERVHFKNALIKSLILPGWGHTEYNSAATKGWILTTASLLNIGSLIYFIVDANKKENDYLNQSDEQLIKQKYDKYNTLYKIRNALIISFAAIWIYAQADLLSFSFDELNTDVRLGFSGNPSSEIPLRLNLNLRF